MMRAVVVLSVFIVLSGCSTIRLDPADLQQAKQIYDAAHNQRGVVCTEATLANLDAINAISAPLPKTVGPVSRKAALTVKADAIAAGIPQAVKDACAPLWAYRLSWWRRLLGTGALR